MGSDAYVLADADKRFGKYAIVRRGKRNHALLRVGAVRPAIEEYGRGRLKAFRRPAVVK